MKNAETTLPPERWPLAPSILLMGNPGAGKTWSLATIAKEGIDVFLLALDPNAVSTAVASFSAAGISIEKLHWATHTPIKGGLSSLLDRAKLYNTQTYEGLTKIKAGIGRDKTNEMMNLYATLMDFKCERTGESFGPVSSWGPDRALVLDPMSSLNKLIWQNFMGLKPALAPGEWGVIMAHEEDLIANLCGDLRCYFIILAHLDRDKDEVTGMSTITPAALGSKLGPRLGQYFSECVVAQRDGADFIWSTIMAGSTAFQRKLPASGKLAPSFAPVIKGHRELLKQIESSGQSTPPSASSTPTVPGVTNNG